MNAPFRPGAARPHYAGKIAVRRGFEIVRKAGLDVGGVELRPDGGIRYFCKATCVAISAREAQEIERD